MKDIIKIEKAGNNHRVAVRWITERPEKHFKHIPLTDEIALSVGSEINVSSTGSLPSEGVKALRLALDIAEHLQQCQQIESQFEEKVE